MQRVHDRICYYVITRDRKDRIDAQEGLGECNLRVHACICCYMRARMWCTWTKNEPITGDGENRINGQEGVGEEEEVDHQCDIDDVVVLEGDGEEHRVV